MHWTQRPGGKAKLSAAIKRGYNNRKQKGTRPRTAFNLAREQVNDLAKIGAETKLARLEKEVERLRLFLGIGGDK